MKVENLAIDLRNRSNWEAIDLGFTLARKWFLRLWGAWLLAALPVFVFVLGTTYLINNEIYTSWIFVLFWWLKPLYEQPLLYILSRQLFSEPVKLGDVLKNYFNVIKPQLGALLLWRRFSLSRSFNNPVAMLENLHGKSRRERLNVLHAQQSSTSQWLTIVCLHIEYFICFAALIFIASLVPSEYNSNLLNTFMGGEDSVWMSIITYVAYFISMSIVAPMYVAAGFALYINRRIKLEGWDIELAFKRMNNRIESGSSKKLVTNKTSPITLLTCLPFAACLLFGTLAPNYSYADSNSTITQETAKNIIEEVLQHEDFGEKNIENEWVFVGTDTEEESKLPFESILKLSQSLKLLIEALIWLTIIGLILWLISKYSHWLNWLNLNSRSKNEAASIPNKILGMDIGKESLPDDIPARFKQLIDSKQYRAALGLLYRATLSVIVHRGDIEIPTSATEQECSQLVTKKRSKEESSFFKALTQSWVMLAYADKTPSQETLIKLCDGWKKLYSSQNNEEPA